jgi:glycosyltransferase involved in cell wall biosynthesis
LGVQTTVIAPLYRSGGASYGTQDGSVKMPPIYTFIHKLFYPLKIYKAFRYIESSGILQSVRLMHAHTLFADGGIAYLLHKKYGIGYILAIRNTDMNFFWNYFPFYRPFAKKVLKNAKNIVFISESYRLSLLQKPAIAKMDIGKKMHSIPNGIDDAFLQKKLHPKQIGDTLQLLFIGKFNKNKNIERIIEAFGFLTQTGLNARLTLLGKEADDAYSVRIARMAKYNKNITIREKTKNFDELAEVYQNAHIFIMPSFAETFGLVYIEAMSFGLPVIWTKGQGIDGYYQGGDVGYPVNPKSAKNLKEAVQQILANYTTLSANCIAEAQKYKWISIAESYKKLYSND